MSGQDQNVKAGGTALQAGKDIIIHTGVSPDQMSEIMVAIAKTTAAFTKEALDIANARMDDFRDEILKRFSEQGKADPEAFKDPDFQYLLRDAQEAVARSGDEAVRDTLVDIVARRSLENRRTRLAITLNDAATRAVNLTKDEFSTLSLTYLLKYTSEGIGDRGALSKYVREKLLPLAHGVSREAASFWLIQSQSCGNVELSQVDLPRILRQTYAGVLGDGVTREQIEASLPEGKKAVCDGLIIACLNDPNKLQFRAQNFDRFREIAALNSIDLSEVELRNVWNVFEGSVSNVKEKIVSNVPEASLLFEVWQNTSLKSLSLTSVGIAIGHAHATKFVGLNAPLEIWIR